MSANDSETRTRDAVRVTGMLSTHASDAFQTVRTPLAVLDAMHRVIEANGPFYDVFRLTPEQTLGRSLQDIAGGLWDTPAYRKMLESSLPHPMSVAELEDGRESAPGVARTLLVSMRPMVQAADLRPLFLVSFEDVTQRARQVATLQQQAVEWARSNRDLEQFAYVASHDLQEPLRMIASYSELLAKRFTGKLGEDGDKFLHYVHDGALRMQQLVNDLLEYAHIATQPRQFVAFASDEVLQQAIDALKMQIEQAGARIERDTLPLLYGDPGQIRQVFQNLVSNAIKFRRAEPPLVQIRAQQKEGRLLLEVRDNGIGVKPELAGRLFQPFQRLHARGAYPGTGIGLALCRRIIERHAGEIRLESDGQTGTSIHIELPLMEGSE